MANLGGRNMIDESITITIGLRDLVLAINDIDGGCPNCIDNFLEALPEEVSKVIKDAMEKEEES
jgi:hypothetical protein